MAPPFFLASAPVSVLDRAKRLVESRGGYYAAGDKDDIFNSMTLGDQESWKVGWKGKVEMMINILKKQNPGQKVIALAIAGGPACDWERGELHNTFCKNHRELVLKQLGDMEDLEAWLDKNHPFAASGAPRSSVMNREGGTGNRSAFAKVAPAPPPGQEEARELQVKNFRSAVGSCLSSTGSGLASISGCCVSSAGSCLEPYERGKNFRGPCADCIAAGCCLASILGCCIVVYYMYRRRRVISMISK